MEIYIGKDGQQLGPYGADSLVDAYSRGDIALTDLAWSEGLPGWIALSDYVAQTGLQLFPAQSAECPKDRPSAQSARIERSQADLKQVTEKAADLAAAAGAAALAVAIQAKEAVAPLVAKATDSLKEAVARNRAQREEKSPADTQRPPSTARETMVSTVAQKSLVLAYLLLFALGSGGAHRFYLGKKASASLILGLSVGGLFLSLLGTGLDSAVLATLGIGMLLGMLVWCLVDAFMLPKMVRVTGMN